MRIFGLVLISAIALGGITGCGATREWVVDFVKDQGVKIVDSQIEKFNENTVAPKFAQIEEDLGRKVDSNNDGLWSDEEIAGAIKESVPGLLGDFRETVLSEAGENTDKSLTERLKDLPTKSDNLMNILYLVAAYFLSKLGIKVGPKGLQKLKDRLEEKKKAQQVDLS